jgi:hypothetical protein
MQNFLSRFLDSLKLSYFIINVSLVSGEILISALTALTGNKLFYCLLIVTKSLTDE